MNQFFGNLTNEARGGAVHFHAVQAPGFGVGQRQFLAGAGDADISEPSFFLEPVGFIQGARRGKQTFFHADQEHERKLQTLGAVQGHQLHTVHAFFHLAFTGLERGISQKRAEFAGRLFFIGHNAPREAAGHRDPFIEVVDA